MATILAEESVVIMRTNAERHSDRNFKTKIVIENRLTNTFMENGINSRPTVSGYNFFFSSLLLFAWTVFAGSIRGSEPEYVMIFGDSITAGSKLPASERPDLWVNRLQTAEKGKFIFINEGKGGRSTNSIDEFRQAIVRHAHVDRLIIALGMNDSRDIRADCVPRAVGHEREMISLARAAYGASLSILILGPTNINKDALGPTKAIGDQRENTLRQLGDGFATLASETGCQYVRLFGLIPSSSLLRDGVHPDAAGNQPIFQSVLSELSTK